MKKCTNPPCHDQSSVHDTEKYCPNCGGSRFETLTAIAAGGAVAMPNLDNVSGREFAPKGIRILAFGVDAVALQALLFLTNIPGLGLFTGLIALLYQLMRDYRGASLGKVLFNLTVVDRYGKKATQRQCLLRNVIFIAPIFLMFIPGLGFVAGEPFILLLYFVELLLLLTTGMRLGDRMAGTIVVKRS